MAELYNFLPKPSQATANQLSVYLDEVNWVSDTNLLTLSVGLLTDASDVTSLGLNLHYDGSKWNLGIDDPELQMLRQQVKRKKTKRQL